MLFTSPLFGHAKWAVFHTKDEYAHRKNLRAGVGWWLYRHGMNIGICASGPPEKND
jgi:hypothetical protein